MNTKATKRVQTKLANPWMAGILLRPCQLSGVIFERKLVSLPLPPPREECCSEDAAASPEAGFCDFSYSMVVTDKEKS